MSEEAKKIIDAFLSAHKSMSWLIVGATGVGKKALVDQVAHSLLGEQGLTTGFKLLECGLTEDAKKKIQKDILEGKSVDLSAYQDTKSEITIDDVRSAINFLSLKTALACKILAISLAEEMNIHAQNALLKTLEEPSDKTLIFLLSENPAKLLPTVLSRCEKIYLHPMTKEQLVDYIQSQYKDINDVQTVVDLSNGLPGVAKKICLYNGLELYRQLLEFLIPIQNLSIERMLAFSQEVSKNENEWDLVTYFILHFLHNQSLNSDLVYAEKIVKLYGWIQSMIRKTHSLYLDQNQVLTDIILRVSENM